MSDEAPQKKGEEGLPAWVMTFADLMSLLMCFFVLLLSFSEMDVAKYKQLAGSMKNAFGVQREIKVKEPPKGINVIAREFSPGRPEPTIINVIRQFTTDDKRINLDLGKERRRPVPTPKSEYIPDRTENFKPHEKAARQADQEKGAKAGRNADEKARSRSGEQAERLAGKQLSQAEGLSDEQKKELKRAKALAELRLQEKLRRERERVASGTASAASSRVDNKVLEKLLLAKKEAERRKKIQRSARLISNALGREIQRGSVDVETDGKKIIIRIREKASFGSGHAELKDSFRPILAKVARILKDSEGQIIVAGHTDNVPIYTERFRSNWELSSARAVSVAHEMMLATDIPSSRFLIQGFADTRPIAPNDTPANRAKNRRVEIILQQGEDREAGSLDAARAAGPVAARPRPGRQPADARGKKVPAPAARSAGRTASVPKSPAGRARVPGVSVKGVRAVGVAPAGKEKVPSDAPEKKKSSGLGIRLGGGQ
ncbi:MAG TPA: type VI secretion system protein TssL [Gammaproteobacteria bacterium]|nr:type VI secretion system protein TssL [Gammaproteobacteria bacterium]